MGIIHKNNQNPYMEFTTVPMILSVVLFSGSAQSKESSVLTELYCLTPPSFISSIYSSDNIYSNLLALIQLLTGVCLRTVVR